jgi:hypothetical protein
MTKHSPFRYFKTSPEIIRLAVMLYVRFPLLRRNVEDLCTNAVLVLALPDLPLSPKDSRPTKQLFHLIFEIDGFQTRPTLKPSDK